MRWSTLVYTAAELQPSWCSVQCCVTLLSATDTRTAAAPRPAPPTLCRALPRYTLLCLTAALRAGLTCAGRCRPWCTAPECHCRPTRLKTDTPDSGAAWRRGRSGGCHGFPVVDSDGAVARGPTLHHCTTVHNIIDLHKIILSQYVILTSCPGGALHIHILYWLVLYI